VSFLDLPDLAALAHVNQHIALLTEDPVLHRTRLQVITPSRVDHSLFGKSPQGVLLRPTIPELVQRRVMRGLHVERRWRAGDYLYSPHVNSVSYSSSHFSDSHRIVGKAVRMRPPLKSTAHQGCAIWSSPASSPCTQYPQVTS